MIVRFLLLAAGLLAAGLLAAGLLASADLAFARTQAPPIAEPAIWVTPAAGLEPIRLEHVSIQIHTSGFLARTRIELTFHNPNNRVLEGEFVFPLGPGQTVSGYALEVDGHMREGVVVPKQTARVAFEDISRQQIDPGLAELTRGNVFRTRLYPIPARGSKRVALSFEHTMPDGGDHYRYLLPLAFNQPVRTFSVRAEASHSHAAPGALAASPDPALQFDRSGQAWIASFTRETVQPQRELAFRIPRAVGESDVLEAADELEPAWRSVVAQVDSGRPEHLSPPAAPRRIGLFFDASGRASARDLPREREALQKYLAALGDVDVDLVAFRNVAESPRRFRVRNGRAGALLEGLAELPLDGGSSYGAINLGQMPGVDLVLVLGDGMSNFGAHEPILATTADASPPPPLHVLHAAQQADHGALARLAGRAGGRVLNLLQLDSAQAASLLVAGDWQLLSVEQVDGQCSDVLPRAPGPVADHLTLSARCRAASRLRLHFGQPGGVTLTRELQFGSTPVQAGDLAESVHRLHAQARIEELESAPHPDVEAITAIGTRHGVVTRYTSLLVLDRIEDYLRYRIEPKEADLRAQYHARLPSLPKREPDDGGAQRIEHLAGLWRDFRGWHETRHPWLESLLLPLAAEELAAWKHAVEQQTPGKQDPPRNTRIRAGTNEAEELHRRSLRLVDDWPKVGDDPTRRTRWERDASELMLQIDELRSERMVLAPGSDLPDSRSTGTQSAEARQQLDRIEVTGSRVREAQSAPSPPVVYGEAAPPPAPSAPGRPAEARPVDQVSNYADAGAPQPQHARIRLTGWDPDATYLAAISAATDPYRAYLAERAIHGTTPGFFLDCADWFRDHAKRPDLALRVLSNIAGLDIDNTALTRVLGYRLAQWGEYSLAVVQFEDALRQRGEEPQSYRDLALALARLPTPDLAGAVELLWQVAIGDWHARFPEIELIALHELNRLLAAVDDDLAASIIATLGIPPELVGPLEVGLRVVMTWDADNTDIDLWVIDPVGEATYYSQNRSRSGGHISRDFTQGYGPEIYTIARPLPGTYRVQAHYYGDRRQTLIGPVTVQVEFQSGFGAGSDEHEAVTRRLSTGRERIDVGEFRVGQPR